MRVPDNMTWDQDGRDLCISSTFSSSLVDVFRPLVGASKIQLVMVSPARLSY